MKARLQSGEKVKFVTNQVGNKTKLYVKNHSITERGQARVKVGWTPAEMLYVVPKGIAGLARDWGGVAGMVHNMGLGEIEIWVG